MSFAELLKGLYLWQSGRFLYSIASFECSISVVCNSHSKYRSTSYLHWGRNDILCICNYQVFQRNFL